MTIIELESVDFNSTQYYSPKTCDFSNVKINPNIYYHESRPGNYMFKVNTSNTKVYVLIFNFEHNSHLVLVLTFLTLGMYTGWVSVHSYWVTAEFKSCYFNPIKRIGGGCKKRSQQVGFV